MNGLSTVIVLVLGLALLLVLVQSVRRDSRLAPPPRRLAHVAFKSDLESRECDRAGRIVLPVVALIAALAVVWLVWTFVSDPIVPQMFP